jgi:hypothetical protein
VPLVDAASARTRRLAERGNAELTIVLHSSIYFDHDHTFVHYRRQLTSGSYLIMGKKKGKKTEEQRSNPDSGSQPELSRPPRPETSYESHVLLVFV